MFSMTQDFFADRCLPRMLLAVAVTAVLQLLIEASISVSRFSRERSGANFSPFVARKISAMLGSLNLNLILMLPWFFILWEAESKGHHYNKPMVTSNISSWKAPGLCDVRTRLETSFDHDVVDQIVVVYSWAVPCPASRWFLWTKCVRHLQDVVTGEIWESQVSSLGVSCLGIRLGDGDVKR